MNIQNFDYGGEILGSIRKTSSRIVSLNINYLFAKRISERSFVSIYRRNVVVKRTREVPGDVFELQERRSRF